MRRRIQDHGDVIAELEERIAALRDENERLRRFNVAAMDGAEVEQTALIKANRIIDRVRGLPRLARNWPFGVDDHCWQNHERRDFARWLENQITSIIEETE